MAQIIARLEDSLARFLATIGALIIALSVSGCRAPLVTYDVYEGGKLDDELAFIGDDRDTSLHSISENDRVIWHNETGSRSLVRLQPGSYLIKYAVHCISDGAFVQSGFADGTYIGAEEMASLEMKPGDRYTVRVLNSGYSCHEGPKLWIEDAMTGQVVSGNRP